MKVEDLLKMEWGSAVEWMIEHQDHAIVDSRKQAELQEAVEVMVSDLVAVKAGSDETSHSCAQRILSNWDRNRGSAWFE